MKLYDMYSGLLGVPYDDGDHDCYGLCRRYVIQNFGIDVPNYARSALFFEQGFDPVSDFLKDTDFSVVDCSPDSLQIGDILFFHIYVGPDSGKANHLGVFVGNGHFIHHRWGRKSEEESLSAAWRRRLLFVARNPEISAIVAERAQKTRTHILDLVPSYVLKTFGLDAATDAAVLEPVHGSGGSSTSGRRDTSPRKHKSKPRQSGFDPGGKHSGES